MIYDNSVHKAIKKHTLLAYVDTKIPLPHLDSLKTHAAVLDE